MSTTTIETTQGNQLEVFGPNFIEFPDSGLKFDCAVITVNDKDGQAHEVAAVYGVNESDYWQHAEQIVKATNAHIRLVNALSALVAANNCNYDRDAMRSEGLFERAELLLRELGEWPQ